MESLPVFQVKVNEWTSEKYFDVLGMKIPVYFTPNPTLLSDVISNFQTRAEDVFVVTYPKSGTTWMQETIWQIYNNGETTSKNIFERVPFLEFSTSPILGEFADIAKVPSPRLIKSHLPYSIIPKGSSDGTKCKYIYIARNPKDVAVSFFHFTVSLASFGNGYNGPWEFFSKLFIDGNVGWNKWNDHVLGWWKHKDDPNVLFLKYEDLKKGQIGLQKLSRKFTTKATCQKNEVFSWKEHYTHQPNSPTPDLSALPSPRIFKTHLPYNVIPKSPNKDTVCKYIYVARNPKDVVVSYYFFWSGISSSRHGPWEFFAKLFVEGNVPWNHWNDHVLDWWKHKDDANILFVKYEDLKKDLLSHVRSIADFLNRPLTDDIISRIAEQSSFSAMKKDRDSVLTVPFRDGRNVPILRKGVVGDWKNYFTPELNERFEKEVLAKLQGSGLEFDFEI